MHLDALNGEVAALAARERQRAARLEDGELVIRLRGAEVESAHAGKWGAGSWCLLVEHGCPASAACRLSGFGLRVSANDAGVLAFGDEVALLRAFAEGPAWARSRRRRPAGSAEQLESFRKSAYRTSSGPAQCKTPAARPVSRPGRGGPAKPTP